MQVAEQQTVSPIDLHVSSPAPRRGRPGRSTLAVLLAVTAIVAALADVVDRRRPPTPRPAAAVPAELTGVSVMRFETTGPSGTRSNLIATQTGDALFQQQWGQDITVDAQVRAATAFVVATGAGEVTCRIVVDGREVDRETADGPGAVATCLWVPQHP